MATYLPRILLTILLLLPWPVRGQNEAFAARVREGNRLMAEGRYAEAARIYTQLAAAHPGDAGLLANLGMAEYLAGHPAEAVRRLEAALSLTPGNVGAAVMLGGAYLQLGQAAKARPILEKAVAAAPEMKEGRQMLGETLAALGRFEDAARQYERWKTLDPGEPKAWYGLARCYDELARAEFEKIRREAPESGYMLALVAGEQQARQQFRSAYALFREALARQPGLRGVHLSISQIYKATGHADWAAAESAKENALGEPPCRPSNAECAFYWARFEEAAKLPARPGTAARYWRARALVELVRHAQTQVVSLGESVESHAVRAAAERDQGRTAESLREWRAALAMAPGNRELERELAVTLRLHEDYDGAQAVVTKLLAANPRSAELNYLMGQILVSRKEPAAAVPYLGKAIAQRPDFLPARSAMGLALVEAGREAEAVPHLSAALPLDTDGTLHFRLGRAQQKLGQTEAARRSMEEYRERQRRSEASKQAEQAEAEITPP